MKKRIATLLTFALSTSLLLGGCGGSTDTEVTNNNLGDSSSGFLSEVTNSKSNQLSECLSEEKVIGYVVKSVDKAEIPKNIYFFDGGKLTIIPGEEFGLTMGDFAKMKDKEIWDLYKTVRETYTEKYKNQKISSYFGLKEERLQLDLDNCLYYLAGLYEYEDEDDNDNPSLCLSVEFAAGSLDADESKQIIEDFYSGSISVQECCSYLINRLETKIQDTKDSLELLQKEKEEPDSIHCAIPFVDLPFKFMVETDSSGNNVLSEFMIHPTLDYAIGYNNESQSYSLLEFTPFMTRQQDIYDTTYNCIGLNDGDYSFLTREVMDIDTLDSKNILIDLTSDELNEIFKEEVDSRHK